jgi:hypothetical protein
MNDAGAHLTTVICEGLMTADFQSAFDVRRLLAGHAG